MNSDNSLPFVNFTRKWLSKFRNSRTTYSALFDSMALSDDCATLGFQMDSGEAFEAAYPGRMNNLQEFGYVIDEIEDVQLLGSAIHSQWRYFNHWNDYGTFNDDNRRWFIMALERLTDLVFEGNRQEPIDPFKTLYIESNCICFGPMPEPEDIVEQKLEFHDDGFVRVADYV